MVAMKRAAGPGATGWQPVVLASYLPLKLFRLTQSGALIRSTRLPFDGPFERPDSVALQVSDKGVEGCADAANAA